jgi:hypothetical protein
LRNCSVDLRQYGDFAWHLLIQTGPESATISRKFEIGPSDYLPPGIEDITGTLPVGIICPVTVKLLIIQNRAQAIAFFALDGVPRPYQNIGWVS